MSSTASAPTGLRGDPESHGRLIELRWDVSTSALERMTEAPVVDRSASTTELALELTIRADASGESVLRAGRTELARESHGTGELLVVEDAGRAMEHLDVPGVVSCTLRAGEVVYARAPILGRLGLPGGRYEIARTKDAER